MEKAHTTGQLLKDRVSHIFNALSQALSLCSDEQYVLPLPLLSGSSVGEHTRHIIEFFQCLQAGLNDQNVDYGKRKRDRTLETDKVLAIRACNQVCKTLPFEEKLVWLKDSCENRMDVEIRSGYHRELLYAIEHAIHHMAIIKIGLKSMGLPVEKDFGVASSTLAYQNACAS